MGWNAYNTQTTGCFVVVLVAMAGCSLKDWFDSGSWEEESRKRQCCAGVNESRRSVGLYSIDGEWFRHRMTVYGRSHSRPLSNAQSRSLMLACIMPLHTRGARPAGATSPNPAVPWHIAFAGRTEKSGPPSSSSAQLIPSTASSLAIQHTESSSVCHTTVMPEARQEAEQQGSGSVRPLHSHNTTPRRDC